MGNNDFILSSGLGVAQLRMDTAQLDVAASAVPGRHMQQIVSQTVMNGGQVAGISSIVKRIEDLLAAQQVRFANSKQKEAAIVELYTNQMNAYEQINTGNNTFDVVNSFLNAASNADSTSGVAAFNQKFVSTAQNVCDIISSFASKVQDLWYNSDSDITSHVTTANSTIAKLFRLNEQISLATDPVDLLDGRDVLLNNLSTLIDIQVSYGSKGEALVSLSGSGISIVTGSEYAVLSYTGVQYASDLLVDGTMSDLTMTHVSSEGVTIDTPVTLASNTPQTTTRGDPLSSGEILGLVNLRRTIFPNIMGRLDSVATGVVSQVNEIYSSGAAVPPVKTLSSTQMFNGQDYRSWTGEMKLAVLNGDGTPIVLKDAAGVQTTLRPVVIDLEQYSGSFGVGKPSVSDIINEVNVQFQDSLITERLTLGGLYNIAMVGDSSIAVNGANASTGTLSFQMELDNNSPFSSMFNILDVQVLDDSGAVVPGALLGTLPGNFTVDAGTKTKTYQDVRITVPLDSAATPGTPANYVKILVNMQVMRADGSFGQGWAQFQINNPTANQQLVNQRTYGVPTSGPVAVTYPPGNVATGLAPSADGGVLTAKLVDDNGATIQGQTTPGYFTLSAVQGFSVVVDNGTSQDQGVSGITGTQKGIAHYMGLNNFFVESDTNQASNMQIRQDLQTNSDALSMARLAQVPATPQQVINGTAAGSATLELGGNAPPGATAGDTITVQGVTFTFIGAGPALANQIVIGVNQAATAANIAATLGAYNETTRPFRDLVTFAVDVNSDVVCTANTLGLSTNNITVNSALTPIAGPQANTWANTGQVTELDLTTQPLAGDTLKIGSATFTFIAAGPAANNEILIGATPALTATNIVAALNANNAATQPFYNQVTFAIDPDNPNRVMCNGNITISSAQATTGMGVTAWVNTAPGLILGLTNLIGGTSALQTQNITNYADQIGAGNKRIMKAIANLLDNNVSFVATTTMPATSKTLLRYLSSGMALIASEYNIAHTRSKIETAVSQNVQEQAQQLYAPNKDVQTAELYDASKLYQMLSIIMQMQRENFRQLIRSAGG